MNFSMLALVVLALVAMPWADAFNIREWKKQQSLVQADTQLGAKPSYTALVTHLREARQGSLTAIPYVV